jgi:alkanesulfonate monooxygenase SsuD/methylene tetrahydromethanopterin reductase-like flavin-dependent oxidoreductase (luciferase family)
MHVGYASLFQNLTGALTDREVWRNELARADAAERLGFGSIWCTEHHFDGYTMSPNVLQFLTWVAARSERIRLGSAVVVLPWHDPVRVAEDLCVLDHMSGGRLVLGIGRGLGRIEFDGFRLEMGESRQRFLEHAEAIMQAFDTGHIAYDGEHYRQPRVDIRPAPLATLRGRTYASAVSPESMEIMARLGVGLMIIPQKPWATVVDEIAAYRELFVKVNGFDPPKPIVLAFTTVHADRARADELFEAHTKAYYRSVVAHYEFGNDHLATVPGYEYYGRLNETLGKHGLDAFVDFLAGLQVSGTPGEVTEQLVEITRMIDGAGVIAVSSFGDMPDDDATANMHLFAREVLPVLEATDAGRLLASGVLPLRS